MSAKSDPARGAEIVTIGGALKTRGQPYRSLYIGGAGNVNVVMAAVAPGTSTTNVLFTAVPVGTILPVECLGVATASTTGGLAGLIVGLF